MHDTTLHPTRGHAMFSDLMIAALGWLWVSLGLVCRLDPIGIVVGLMLVPLLAMMVLGWEPKRGATIAVIATIFCVGIIATGPLGSPLNAILVVGLINIGAIVGANASERLRVESTDDPVPAGWTVQVEIVYPNEIARPANPTERQPWPRPAEGRPFVGRPA